MPRLERLKELRLADGGWVLIRNHDAVNQVTSVVTDVRLPQRHTTTETYGYDLRGNRVSSVTTTVSGKTTHTDAKVDYVYDFANQVVQVHDHGDNLNNAKDDTTTTWARDGLGRALSVSVNGAVSRRLFDGTAVIVEGDTQVTYGTTGHALSEVFDTVEGHGAKAVTVTTVRDVLTDALGSTVAVATDGLIDADLTWFADFGDILDASEWSGSIVTAFTGRTTAAGLTEFATRAYDSASRVWVQTDTYPGTAIRASSMNRYTYVEGAPETYVDVMGAYRAAAALVFANFGAKAYAVFVAELKRLAAEGLTAERVRAEKLRQLAFDELDAQIAFEQEMNDLWLYNAVGDIRYKWDMTVDWGSDVQSRGERTSVAENVRDAFLLTQLTETVSALGALWFDNGEYYAAGPLCGVEMECFVNTSFSYGTITLGHTVNSSRSEFGDVLATHEYGHVLDVEEAGALFYYPAYALSAPLGWSMDKTSGDKADIHDSNPFERRSLDAEDRLKRGSGVPTQGFISDFWDEVLS